MIRFEKGADQVRRLLLFGFGGLLLLLAAAGLKYISILNSIQQGNARIRADFVSRDRILEQLRSDVYLSGTYARDLLLEPDPSRAVLHRAGLEDERSRIASMIAAYAAKLRPEERAPFLAFQREVTAYFELLRPAVQWSADQRSKLGYAFTRDTLIPRRTTIIRLADQIGQLNQRQMEAGSLELENLFINFRRTAILLLVLSLVTGTLLAIASIYRILRLERISAARFDEVEAARGALRELSTRLVQVQESERRALSRDLHDEVGQSLSALLLGIGNAAALLPSGSNRAVREQLLELRGLAERTVAVVRDMSLLLRPSMLDDLGLIPALEWQAREVSRNNNLRVEVNAQAVSADLSDEHKTCVFRIVQEALRNVIRHARARHAFVELTQDDEALRLIIRDDGRGFQPSREKGIGLVGIEERVAHLNGQFSLQSQPGQGTVIKIDLPLAVSA